MLYNGLQWLFLFLAPTRFPINPTRYTPTYFSMGITFHDNLFLLKHIYASTGRSLELVLHEDHGPKEGRVAIENFR
jgi:hypothetical protein